YAERFLPRAETLMARHGGKTVFFGRFIAVLRFTAAWVAGLGRMEWWRFLFWNAAGGIVWATGVGLVAYYSGRAAADAIRDYGLFAGAGIAAVVIGISLFTHYAKKRLEDRLCPAGSRPASSSRCVSPLAAVPRRGGRPQSHPPRFACLTSRMSWS